MNEKEHIITDPDNSRGVVDRLLDTLKTTHEGQNLMRLVIKGEDSEEKEIVINVSTITSHKTNESKRVIAAEGSTTEDNKPLTLQAHPDETQPASLIFKE